MSGSPLGHYADVNSPIASSPQPVKRARYEHYAVHSYDSPDPAGKTSVPGFVSPTQSRKPAASIPPRHDVRGAASIPSPSPTERSRTREDSLPEGTKLKSDRGSQVHSANVGSALQNVTSQRQDVGVPAAPSSMKPGAVGPAAAAGAASAPPPPGEANNTLLSTFFSPVLQFIAAGGGGTNAEDTNGNGDAFEAGHSSALPSVEIDSKWESKEESTNCLATANVLPPVEVAKAAIACGRDTPDDVSMGENSEDEETAVSTNNMSSVSASDNGPVQSGTNREGSYCDHGLLSNTTAASDAKIEHPQDEQTTPETGEDQAQGQEDQSGNVVDEFNPYAFIKSLPPYNKVVPPHRPRPILLPKKNIDSPDITLVLDLDETLVHCSIEPIANPDFTFSVDFNGALYDVYVRKRPHFQHFLEQVSHRFEVVVFTASQQVYAERLLNILDPTKSLIKHRLYRDACLCVEGNYLKDLSVLGRDINKMVLVDNSPHAFGYQVDNGIPIESWFDDDNDTELLKLGPFLDRLHGVADVRSVLKRQFNLQGLVDQSSMY